MSRSSAFSDEDKARFVAAIDALEAAVLDPSFRAHVEAWCRANCTAFEDTDENRLEWMDLFQQYTEMIETCLEAALEERVPGFNMAHFMAELERQPDALGGEVFDLLMSLGEWDDFKSLMLSYKMELLGGSEAMLSHDLLMPIVTPLATSGAVDRAEPTFEDEDCDGDTAHG